MLQALSLIPRERMQLDQLLNDVVMDPIGGSSANLLNLFG